MVWLIQIADGWIRRAAWFVPDSARKLIAAWKNIQQSRPDPVGLRLDNNWWYKRVKKFSFSPRVLIDGLLSNKNLIAGLVKREVLGRYRGSVLGLLWSFFYPLLMLLVYTFVFGVVFQARTGVHEDKAEFAVFLFTGLMVYLFFSECLTRSPTLITGKANFVKKIIFPLETLPWVLVGSSMVHLFISVLILLLFVFIIHGGLTLTVLLFPLVLAPLVLFVIGMSWALAAMSVFLQDIRHVVGVASSALLFLSPVFYSVSRLPESVQFIFYLNPLTFIIEQSRNVLLKGVAPDWGGLMIYYLIATVVLYAGFVIFQKLRGDFADVI